MELQRSCERRRPRYRITKGLPSDGSSILWSNLRGSFFASSAANIATKVLYNQALDGLNDAISGRGDRRPGNSADSTGQSGSRIHLNIRPAN